jgi:hypothetical protein
MTVLLALLVNLLHTRAPDPPPVSTLSRSPLPVRNLPAPGIRAAGGRYDC